MEQAQEARLSTNVPSAVKIKGITFDSQGYPVYPLNEKGLPILPKDRRDQPFFPTTEYGVPVFPYDHQLQKWTFPVDDTEDPIFPRNSANKPLVPQDYNGIFLVIT